MFHEYIRPKHGIQYVKKMPEIIKITTCRGAIKIAYEGYVYTKLRALANGYISYECDQRDKRKGSAFQCRAKIKVKDDEVVRNDVEHTHASDVSRVHAMKTAEAIRKRAIDTQETPQTIISNAVTNVSQGKQYYYIVLIQNLCKK